MYVIGRFLPTYCLQHMALTQSGEERAKTDSEKEDKAARTKVRVSPVCPYCALPCIAFCI